MNGDRVTRESSRVYLITAAESSFPQKQLQTFDFQSRPVWKLFVFEVDSGYHHHYQPFLIFGLRAPRNVFLFYLLNVHMITFTFHTFMLMKISSTGFRSG